MRNFESLLIEIKVRNVKPQDPTTGKRHPPLDIRLGHRHKLTVTIYFKRVEWLSGSIGYGFDQSKDQYKPKHIPVQSGHLYFLI